MAHAEHQSLKPSLEFTQVCPSVVTTLSDQYDVTRDATARTPQEQTALERQITDTDTKIDRLVYDLYGLTDAEIKIVEGTV